MTGVALVVLCGGRGERLGGGVKPLLRFDHGRGKTILEEIERVLSPHVENTVLVAPKDVVPALQRVSSARIVEDRGRGPGEALLDSARVIYSEWMLVVAGDHPCPSVQLYSRLVEGTRAAADAVAVLEGGKLLPTYALYRRDALLAITRIEGAHGIALSGVLEALEVFAIDAASLTEEEKRGLLDVDTPEQAWAHGLAFEPRSNQ